MPPTPDVHDRPQSSLDGAGPALGVTCALAVWLGAIFVLQILAQSDLYFVRKQEMLGLDIRDFFVAGQSWAAGQSPYASWRYVTPPLPAAISALLVPLGWPRFLAVAIAGSILSCIGGYVLAVRAFDPLPSSTRRAVLLLGLACLFCSAPFLFLIDRANIDGVVFALMTAAILLSEGAWCVIGGTFLAVAMSIKLYPALLLVPVVVHRKSRLLLATLGAFAALVLISGVDMWREYLSSQLLQRGTFFRVNENGSLLNFCHFLATLIGGPGEPVLASYALFAVLLGATVTVDVIRYRRGACDWPFTVFSYFPFMVAVPATVYQYSFVILLALIPLLCAAGQSPTDRWARWAIVMACAGVVLTQSHAVALQRLVTVLQISPGLALWAYFLPSLGLVMSIVGLLWLKIRRLAVAGVGALSHPARWSSVQITAARPPG